MQGYHKSVLFSEVIEALHIKEGEWYLDATLGDGGYSLEILKRGGKVLGVDVDPQALERSRKRFESEGINKDRFRLVQGNFRDLDILIEQAGIADQKFAGAIFDLGVSSLQLETPERGFSFGKLGTLDMRMDPTLQVKALDLVNGLHKGELYELFEKLGEEKFARAIADTVVFKRSIKKIETTKELADLVWNVYRRFGGKDGSKGKIHPATKVFQALRIAVNDELHVLEEGLLRVRKVIKKDGHIIVISFHSLEDRIVKTIFREWESNGFGKVLTKKPIVASLEELAINPRARSAKMRVFFV